MGMGACDACRAARAGCSQESPQCRRCSNLGRTCTYFSFKLRDSPCLTCRSRKKRCDRRRPVCGVCDRLGLSCQYARRGSAQDVQILGTRSTFQIMAKVCHFQDRIALAEEQHILSRSFQYDAVQLRMRFTDGRIVRNVNPMLLLKDLTGSLNPGDQVMIGTESLLRDRTEPPSFFVTASLVNCLTQLFFDRINPHQPLLTEEYFRTLSKEHPNRPDTVLLSYTICLHGTLLFPEVKLINTLKHVFCSLVFKMISQCYSRPTLNLAIVYLLLALMPLSELDHPRALPPRHYQAMATRLIFQLGIHLPHNIHPRITQLRKKIVLNAFLIEINVASNSLDSTTTSILDSLDPTLAHSAPQHTTTNTQLQFQTFILKFSYRMAKLQLNTPSQHQLRTIETHLHAAMQVYCPPDTPGLIHIPTNPKLLHRFRLYCNILAELYRPHLNPLNPPSPSHLNHDAIPVHRFLLISSECKTLFALNLFARALQKHQDEYLRSSYSYKWWPLTSQIFHLNSFLSSLNPSHPLHSHLTSILETLQNHLAQGCQRWGAARFAHAFVKSMLHTSCANISISNHR
ncbi:hypothetical protein DSO57_1013005 [Entomophthora muscae]|uniref:Uncharacterized protein n=1 Tax=Entomophthora muscae TaxID=34485 RepID=A0ACC2UQN8_9FUNG|nr:hypothetical protein DSO57_1013005 [Entomophthora muscae]